MKFMNELSGKVILGSGTYTLEKVSIHLNGRLLFKKKLSSILILLILLW